MPIIKVKSLSKHYKQHKKEPGLAGSVKALYHREYNTIKAVNDISFEVEQGEIVGFIGPNGAGKTTTLKMLSGLLHPTSGELSVLGYLPYERKPEFQKQFSLVMGQKNQLWWDLPAIESFSLNKEIYEIEDKQFNQIVEELSELLDIKDVLKVQVRKLSLGQRMKAELLAALLHQPKVLFLDEPTIGLDVVVQKKIREFFREYNRQYQTTVLLTSHYMDDVKELCKRIIIIDGGQKVYDDTIDSLVKKYATKKNLTFIFLSPVKKEDMLTYGEVVYFDSLKVTLSVDLSEHTQIASKILNDYQVDDLDIHEISLEDIIRNIFMNHK